MDGTSPESAPMSVNMSSLVTVVVSLVFCGNVLAAETTAPEYGPAVKVTKLLTTAATMIGQPIAYPKYGRPEVTALEVEIPPGRETGWHRHPVPGLGYILTGTLTVDMADGRRFRLAPGQAVVESLDALHNGRNLGRKPVRLVVFFTGEAGKAFTVPGAKKK